MRNARIVGIIFVLAAFVACGGSGSVTGPSGGPSYPAVSGTYSGTVNFVFPELGTSLSCPASTVVTQSGSSVNMAPVIATGQCAGMSIPVGAMTIDTNGGISALTGGGTYNEPTCGVYNYAASGGFFGRELRFSMTATSATCWNFNFTAVLAR